MDPPDPQPTWLLVSLADYMEMIYGCMVPLMFMSLYVYLIMLYGIFIMYP